MSHKTACVLLLNKDVKTKQRNLLLYFIRTREFKLSFYMDVYNLVTKQYQRKNTAARVGINEQVGLTIHHTL